MVWRLGDETILAVDGWGAGEETICTFDGWAGLGMKQY